MISSTKYIGMDVHKESISIAVMNSVGKVVMESVLETKASSFFKGDVQISAQSVGPPGCTTC